VPGAEMGQRRGQRAIGRGVVAFSSFILSPSRVRCSLCVPPGQRQNHSPLKRFLFRALRVSRRTRLRFSRYHDAGATSNEKWANGRSERGNWKWIERRAHVKLRRTRPFGWIGKEIDLVEGGRSGYSMAARITCSIRLSRWCHHGSEALIPAVRDMAGVIIPICPSKRSSSRCRRNHWPGRIAGSRPP